MIKRRFYRFEHGDKDAPSESSSSSDSEVKAEATDETEFDEEEEEEEEGNAVGEEGNEEESPSSGYESEDSSMNEDHLDSSGLPQSDDDLPAQNGKLNILRNSSREDSNSSLISTQHNPGKDEIEFDVANCVLKSKSVFKCRLCPRVVCLSVETLKAHLNSKKHARSEKLLREGRLKLMLNDDGKIEGETELQKPDTTISGQPKTKSKKKGKERFNQKRTRQRETTIEKSRGTGKRQKNNN